MFDLLFYLRSSSRRRTLRRRAAGLIRLASGRPFLTHTFVAVLIAFALECTAQQQDATDLDKDRRFNSVAWMQNAAEYRQLTRQSYRYALAQLIQGLQDDSWSADEVQLAAGDFADKRPAVILDIDETILDNSPFNARGIIDREQFSQATWQAWCLEEKATAIPGALEFVKQCQKLGVRIFYVTNRVDAVKTATVNNLKALGFPADEEIVLTRNDDKQRGGDKISRRAMVARDHRIVLLIGDNLSDLCAGMGTQDQAERNKSAAVKARLLGTRWILLPNPVYGSWERALPAGKSALRTVREEPSVKK